VTKPSQLISDSSVVSVVATGPDYVSRGALKLEKALDTWEIDPTGKIVLDVGASTGGFTDLLLRRGALRVYAVDVGYGQLHYKLRNDARVISMERTNVRHLTALPEPISLGVVDVSFISLKLALPTVFNLVSDEVVALIKPQFEAGRAEVGKGGVVRDPAIHKKVLSELTQWSTTQPFRIVEIVESPIKGPAGNVEFLSHWLPSRAPSAQESQRNRLSSGA
jgi:23S rRNA (cytidine1920-2'-O)/16S rRNA (cytidine1409-2'-O)-methyltransferase